MSDLFMLAFVTGPAALVLAVVFGVIFGVLLHQGRVTSYNVIVNQFRLKDWTVLKVMLTAIVVGGIGVAVMNAAGWTNWHVKSADLLGVIAGATLFGVGMVLYGYCPGTGVAAIGAGSLHALVGAVGMLVGGALYAFSFDWVKANVLSVWSAGKVRLPEATGVSQWVWYAALLGVAIAVAAVLTRGEQRGPGI